MYRWRMDGSTVTGGAYVRENLRIADVYGAATAVIASVRQDGEPLKAVRARGVQTAHGGWCRCSCLLGDAQPSRCRPSLHIPPRTANRCLDPVGSPKREAAMNTRILPLWSAETILALSAA